MQSTERRSAADQEETSLDAAYVQTFVYRVPKANHGEFASVEAQLADIFKEHGVVRSELYTFTQARIFKGFTSVAETLAASNDDEVWLELDYYRDARDRDEVIA